MTDQRVRRPGPVDDEGAVLVLVLVFLLVIGVTISVTVSQATTSLRNTDVVRNKSAKVYTADAGVDAGVMRVRQDTSLCPNSNAGRQTIPGLNATSMPAPSSTGNGVPLVTPSLQVTCRIVSGSTGGANGFAIITTDTSSTDSLSTQGGSSALGIEGPVYAGNWLSEGPNAIAMTMQNADAYRSPASGCPANDPKPSGLTFDPATPFTYRCADPLGAATLSPASQRPYLFAKKVDHRLPAFPAADRWSALTGPAVSVSGSCSTFLPGRYKAPLGTALLPSKLPLTADNYFASGVYYFENVDITVKASDVTGNSMSVVAGTPGPDDTVLNRNRSTGQPTSPCATDSMAKTLEPSYDDKTTGVVWVLGGSSRIQVESGDSQLELFGRSQGQSATALTGAPDLSVVAVPDDETVASGYVPSNVTYSSGTPLIWQAGGNNPQMAFHGLLYAPKAQISLNNTTGGQGNRFGNGVVAGRLTLQNSSSAGGFLLSVKDKPTKRVVEVQATAGGAAGEGQKVISTGVFEIANDTTVATTRSWRSATEF